MLALIQGVLATAGRKESGGRGGQQGGTAAWGELHGHVHTISRTAGGITGIRVNAVCSKDGVARAIGAYGVRSGPQRRCAGVGFGCFVTRKKVDVFVGDTSSGVGVRD